MSEAPPLDRRPWKRWALVVAVFAIVSLGYTAWRGSVQRPELTLPDGRGVSLLQATVGTTHELEQGSIFARLIARVAGQNRAQRFGYRSVVQRTPAPALVVWTLWPVPPTNPPPRYATVMDDDGMETEPIYPLMDASASMSGERIMTWRFDNFPRRAKSFRVRFHDRPPPYHTQPLGALRIRNPSPTNAPPIGGREAPFVAANDPDITLARLEVGGEMPSFRRASHSGLAPWTDAVFEVRDNGARSTNWTIRDLQLRSASGNVVATGPLFKRARAGRIETGFTCAWWRDEPDWTLTTIFGRIGDFGDTNLWTLAALSADGLRTALSTNIVAPFLAPPGGTIVLRPAGLQSSGAPGRTLTTDVELTYRPDNRHRRLELVRVTDQAGEEIGFLGSNDNGYGRLFAGLELRSNTTAIHLTFGISYTRAAEFRVKPRFIGTNSPTAPAP